MALTVNQNIAALNAYRNLSNTQNDLSKSLEKLSSGLRINRAADDAAGLAISEGLRSQVGGLKVAARNAQDGISVVQTAEGALTEVHAILQRLRDLSVQAGNDSNNDKARANIATEANSLVDELDRIGKSTNFNGINLLDGTAGAGGTLTFQVGAGGANSNSTIDVDLSSASLASFAADLEVKLYDADTEAWGADGVLDFSTAGGAQAAVDLIDGKIEAISTARAELGAYQNRFEHTIKSVNVAIENLSASESRIRDTDVANETVAFTRAQILSQAGTTILAQAKNLPQSVLQLLQ
ncbi:flagellin [Xylanimonas oleitrophica]|uniref:Flagellin n=1 Tax=Xylanimonas oleitrophica TaxID=2607479 RepID=A0A2W5WSL8_9MICO|nr:flagellin [Xylanimonas oleitrophica]PZR54120.1 flagellin [Xylanimonas oleitrophica]